MATCLNCGETNIGDNDAFEWRLEGPLCSLACAEAHDAS